MSIVSSKLVGCLLIVIVTLQSIAGRLGDGFEKIRDYSWRNSFYFLIERLYYRPEKEECDLEMDTAFSRSEETRELSDDPRNDAQILMHMNSNIAKNHDLAHLKISEAMPEKIYSRNSTEIDNGNYYTASDKKTQFSYLKINDVPPPYSINTVHLQNPYKGIMRSRDPILRWRYNNLITRNESIARRNKVRENEQIGRSRKKKKKLCTELSTVARQYCANSTLHGLRYVGDPELSMVERIFWIISFTCAFLTVAYYIFYLYQKWNLAPVIISLSPEPVPLSEFPFPSITICNMNQVKRSEAKRIEQGYNTTDKILVEDFCNFDNGLFNDNDSNAIDWTTMLRFMINVTQPCTDMLHYCQWHGNQTECDKIFNPAMTDEGICCNFNGVHRKYLFYNAHDWSDLNITFPYITVDWNAENGYNTSTPADAVPWRPYGAGLAYGLTLVLDADIDEYYCSSTASVGFKMILHNPVETPKVADFSFAISPGRETRVIVKPRISTARKTIVSIPQRKRKCFFTSERKLRYYRTYTQRNCALECEANFTQNLCQCVQYYMPKSAKTHICGKRDDQCAQLARRTMEVKLYDEDTVNTLNITEAPSCNCLPACFEINYKVGLSESQLLSAFTIEKPYVKKNMEYFTKNMAVVHLFFVDSQFTKYMKTELFGFTEFLSSTGGLLGLFLGFSFLSFMEIVYFLTMRLWYRLHDNRDTSSKPAVLQVQSKKNNRKVIYPYVN